MWVHAHRVLLPAARRDILSDTGSVMLLVWLLRYRQQQPVSLALAPLDEPVELHGIINRVAMPPLPRCYGIL